ncbi:gliding motility lipoprotein GldH [Adhaeribacter aquaticus]|uniref:gliding motility lipoprotein GldH n=1 Tax=Adhaeribacter aquaticus TaxID=299567 RepID=UPI00040B8174|nr:gliding motility lipoprotein GldH [Adhaeribacter aquaticus]
MRKQFFAVLITLFTFFLSACDNNRVYEENIDLANNNWRIEDKKSFDFEIKDTSKSYNIYFNIRNVLSYEFYNLYVSQTLTDPDGQILYTRLHEMYLMDRKTGEPLGSGAGDIFDHTFLAIKNQKFSKEGKYNIRLTQYMRKNPLPGIMAVGIKVAIAE